MIDADDLALLASSFDAAMRAATGAVESDAALCELGWVDLLDAAPLQGAAMAFGCLGATGSTATLLDDVLLAALGLVPSAGRCVVLPAPQRWNVPGTSAGGRLRIEGLVSSRVESAQTVIVHTESGVAEVEAEAFRCDVAGVDVGRPYRRVSLDLADASITDGAVWSDAVALARLALAHQLIAVSRHMLELARTHAIDRMQFGRSIASFQAVRHKLAECLVAIEGAAAVASTAVELGDPLFAAVAKSLAGKAARLTAAHAQQVLAGIGFTTDHTFHLFMKRALVLDTLFGSARTLPGEIGRTLLASGVPRLVEL